MTMGFLMVGNGILINTITTHHGIADFRVIFEGLTFTIDLGTLHMATLIMTTMAENLLDGSLTEVGITINLDGIADYQVILAVFIFIMIHGTEHMVIHTMEGKGITQDLVILMTY